MAAKCIECGSSDDWNDLVVDEFPEIDGTQRSRCHECYGQYLSHHTDFDEETAKVAALAYIGYSNLDIEAVVESSLDIRDVRREIYRTTGHPPEDLEQILSEG